MSYIDEAVYSSKIILGENVRIEPGVYIGHREDGADSNTEPVVIGDNSIIRTGAIIYEGVRIGCNTHIGHNCVIRYCARLGDNSVLSHNVVIEHHGIIGNWVRISPHTHITSNVVIEDRVFIGAGVVTINDKYLVWKNKDFSPDLTPQYIEYGSRIGSGSTLLPGIRVGRQSIVGAASLVTKDVPSNVTVYGHPAKVIGDAVRECSTPNGLD